MTTATNEDSNIACVTTTNDPFVGGELLTRDEFFCALWEKGD